MWQYIFSFLFIPRSEIRQVATTPEARAQAIQAARAVNTRVDISNSGAVFLALFLAVFAVRGAHSGQ